MVRFRFVPKLNRTLIYIESRRDLRFIEKRYDNFYDAIGIELFTLGLRFGLLLRSQPINLGFNYLALKINTFHILNHFHKQIRYYCIRQIDTRSRLWINYFLLFLFSLVPS